MPSNLTAEQLYHHLQSLNQQSEPYFYGLDALKNALLLAIREDHEPLLNELLDSQVITLSTNTEILTACLKEAAERQNTHLVSTLISRIPQQPYLDFLCSIEGISSLEFCVENQLIDGENSIHLNDLGDVNILHYAIYINNVSLYDYLIAHFGDDYLVKTSSFGWSPFLIACYAKAYEIIDNIESRSNVDYSQKIQEGALKGKSAYRIAVHNDDLTLIHYLLSNRNPNRYYQHIHSAPILLLPENNKEKTFELGLFLLATKSRYTSLAHAMDSLMEGTDPTIFSDFNHFAQATQHKKGALDQFHRLSHTLIGKKCNPELFKMIAAVFKETAYLLAYDDEAGVIKTIDNHQYQFLVDPTLPEPQELSPPLFFISNQSLNTNGSEISKPSVQDFHVNSYELMDNPFLRDLIVHDYKIDDLLKKRSPNQKSIKSFAIAGNRLDIINYIVRDLGIPGDSQTEEKNVAAMLSLAIFQFRDQVVDCILQNRVDLSLKIPSNFPGGLRLDLLTYLKFSIQFFNDQYSPEQLNALVKIRNAITQKLEEHKQIEQRYQNTSSQIRTDGIDPYIELIASLSQSARDRLFHPTIAQPIEEDQQGQSAQSDHLGPW